MAAETKKKKTPLMGYMSKTHPVKRVKVDNDSLKAAIKKARENERNWYRVSDDDEESFNEYNGNSNTLFDYLY